MKTILYTFCFVVWLPSAYGQIAQSSPQYCGIPGGINPTLPRIAVTMNHGHAELFVGDGESTGGGIPLPGLVSAVAEVCPLSDGRLVVFADTFNGEIVSVVDAAKKSLGDWFRAFLPVISPDQRWIVYGKFYPLHTELPTTDEYLIYDLTKSPAENRPDYSNIKDDEGADHDDVGVPIFPPGQKNVDLDNIGVPEDQQHHQGSQFYWAADSRAIVVVDWITKGPRSIVLVTLNDRGTPVAFNHQVTNADICGGEVAGVDPNRWTVDRAEVGPDRQGSRSIAIDLNSGDGRCPPRVLQLYKEDFQSTKREIHVIE